MALVAMAGLLTESLQPGIGRFFLSMWGPAVVALLLTLAFDRARWRETLGINGCTARALVIAVSFPFAVAVVTVVLGVLSGALQPISDARVAWGGVAATLVVWVVASLGEEIGWRGYLHAQVRHLLRHAPFVVGVIWASWPALGEVWARTPIAIPVFFAVVFVVSYVLAWLREAGGSVFACAVLHGVWNWLRLKLLFGSANGSTTGLFVSTDPLLTEMEGVFGLLACVVVGAFFVWRWYVLHAQRYLVH